MEWARTKTGLAGKDMNSNEWPIPPGFDRFESFGHDELRTKHCYFSCRPQNTVFYFNVLRPGHLYQKF